MSVDVFKWRNKKFNFFKDFIQSYDENSNKGCILEVDVDYRQELQKAHSDLPFLLLLICMTRKNVLHIKALKSALDHGPILEKVHSIKECKQ